LTPNASAPYWTEVRLRARPDAVEALASFLQDRLGSGVTIEPPIRAFGPDEGYEIDESAPVLLKGYVEGSFPGTERRALRRSIESAGLAEALAAPVRYAVVRQEDWAETWKEHYQVERLGRIVIRPAWRGFEPLPGDVVVSLDPGMAFGTGQHPTTRMCLLLLQELTGVSERVVDVGTGSGILAIAAIGLGARECFGFDTEELAVKAARENVALNEMTERIRIEHGGVEVMAGLPPFDLAFANITAGTIMTIAQTLYDSLVPGGRLIASGIIGERQAVCEAALTDAGFRIDRRLEEGDWRALTATRPS
jgi:ribosomal protein L11 methyltransferase